MKAETKDFLLAEYSHLRSEIQDAVQQVPANEKWALTISGVFWAWLGSDLSRAEHLQIVVWIPAVIVFLLFLRWRAIEHKFTAYNTYLKKVEERFEVDGLGWEHHIDDAGRHWFRHYGRITWAALFFINIALAVWAISNKP